MRRRRADRAVPTITGCARPPSCARASSPSSRSTATRACRRGRSSRARATTRRCSTTAGMQPQMPFFLGQEPPPAPLTTTSQKCFRTQDIDEVGLDGHHLTFFEMLGNFSFGQYFKEGAIEFATEFIQNELKLDWDRVWATVHAGDPGVQARPGRDGDRAVGADRHAARADRAAAELGELLVGRRPGPVRAGLGDLLGLGRGVRLRRARLRARVPALRPLPRVLEPRLHGVRAAPRRDADAAAEAEHRHRHGARAHRGDRPGRPLGLRDGLLPVDHGAGWRRRAASRSASPSARRRRTA